MKCKRCGRELKNIKSIELGYGKTCYEKCKTEPKKISLKDFDLI